MTPPGPRERSLLGSYRGFVADPIAFMAQLSREYGDIVRFRVGPETVYQFTHPDQLEQILVKHAATFRKDRVTRELDVVVGNGLLTSEGDHWKRQRKLAAPALGRRAIAAYGAQMANRGTEAAERMRRAVWNAGARGAVGLRLDVHDEMMRTTLDIAADTLFDCDLEAQQRQISESIEGLMHLFVHTIRSVRRFVPKWVPLPYRFERDRHRARLDEVVHGLIADRRASGATGDDLLSRLLRATDEAGAQMTDSELRDEVLTMLVAGHETTALALTFSLHLLAQHPELQERAASEAQAATGPLGPERLTTLPFLEAVVKEAMRLMPPAWAIGREPVEPVTIGGVDLPAGATIIIPMVVMHRDSRWFDQPERFDPERWLDGRTDALPRMAFLPFGGGPRICIGNHFAMMEAVLVLAELLTRLRVHPAPGFEFELLPSITLRPLHGVPLVVAAR